MRGSASFDAIEKGEFDKATSLVGLAKEDYDAALRLDPHAWDVKFNLDVAARLVRDFPRGRARKITHAKRRKSCGPTSQARRRASHDPRPSQR